MKDFFTFDPKLLFYGFAITILGLQWVKRFASNCLGCLTSNEWELNFLDNSVMPCPSWLIPREKGVAGPRGFISLMDCIATAALDLSHAFPFPARS